MVIIYIYWNMEIWSVMSTKIINNNKKTDRKTLFEEPNHRGKLTIIISGLVALALFLMIGYIATEAGHGPVAGVKGEHKVCTINNIELSLNKDKSNGDLDDSNIDHLILSTKECGVLIVDGDHLSTIDGLLYIYQHVSVNKSYGFRIVDGRYVNHVNIAM